MKRQSWQLAKYVMDFTGHGVALSKAGTYKKFVRYHPPKAYYTQKYPEALLKIAKRFHSSAKKAKKIVQFLKNADLKNFSKDEIEYIKAL